jgi:transcription initiation factor TFIIIB Brf1 subunit/transcription initiation factor TFIIB
MAAELAANVHDSKLLVNARKPEAVAGCCILMVSHILKEYRSQEEIAKLAGIEEAALMYAYGYLLPNRMRVLNPEWLREGDPWERDVFHQSRSK